jgi:hypothetical protein
VADAPLVVLTPAQAATARTNGWLVYSSAVSVTVELADPNWATPKVTPPVTPPPSPVPAPGFNLPAVAAGFKRVLAEAWTSTTLNAALWTTPYNGRSEGGQTGFFVGKHTVLKGDGWLRLQAYPDPAGLAQCWQYDATIAAHVNQWGGAGLQSTALFPATMNLAFVAKWDTMPGMTPIVLLMGRKNWPPEIDILEMNAALKGGVPQPYQQSYHYAAPNSQFQVAVVIAAGADLSQEHLWVFKSTTTGAITTVTDAAGNVAATCTVTYADHTAVAVDPTNSYSLATPQFLGLQHQTGDPGNPPADASVTAANPITMYVGPVAVDIPA